MRNKRAVFESSRWIDLVDKIKRNDVSSVQDLYSILTPIRKWIHWHLGPESSDDEYHDLIVALLEQIRRGDLQQPDRLVGYARAIAARKIAASVKQLVHVRSRCVAMDDVILRDQAPDPEAMAVKRERRLVATAVLDSLSPRDREVLIRFYYDEEPADSIQIAMLLTATQFRLLKSRAKARFARLCQARFSECRPAPIRTGTAMRPVITIASELAS